MSLSDTRFLQSAPTLKTPICIIVNAWQNNEWFLKKVTKLSTEDDDSQCRRYNMVSYDETNCNTTKIYKSKNKTTTN
jgi:hypothetical protein